MPATERAGVRQSDLAKELGLTPAEIKAERDKLGPDDWWQVVRAIYWSEEAASGLRVRRSTPITIPGISRIDTDFGVVTVLNSPQPETLTLRCVKLARNTTFVYCAMGDGIVGVKVKRGLGPKLLKKDIKVRKEGEIYVRVP